MWISFRFLWSSMANLRKTILEKILNPLPLKIPECIPGIIGLVEKWPFSLWWRRYRSLKRYFCSTSFVSSHSGCFPLCLKWPSPFLHNNSNNKKKRGKEKGKKLSQEVFQFFHVWWIKPWAQSELWDSQRLIWWWTHLSQVQHSHISLPSPKKLAP